MSLVPPGLQYLSTIDQLLVQQKVAIFQTYNRYTIKNNQGQKVYYAVEEGACGIPSMSSVNILDDHENEVIHLSRRTTYSVDCFPFCCKPLEQMEVYSPPGVLIGSVKETSTGRHPKLDVRNECGNVVLKIIRPASTSCMCCCEDTEYRVLSVDESTEVGKITKQWRGLMRDLFSAGDYFEVLFLPDLDIRMKAVLLGACILIDYMFFEGGGG